VIEVVLEGIYSTAKEQFDQLLNKPGVISPNTNMEIYQNQPKTSQVVVAPSNVITWGLKRNPKVSLRKSHCDYFRKMMRHNMGFVPLPAFKKCSVPNDLNPGQQSEASDVNNSRGNNTASRKEPARSASLVVEPQIRRSVSRVKGVPPSPSLFVRRPIRVTGIRPKQH